MRASPCFLLALAVGCGAAVASQSECVGGDRRRRGLGFAWEYLGTGRPLRLATLTALHAEGYTCSLTRHEVGIVVCSPVGSEGDFTKAERPPQTREQLKQMLPRVSLGQWLPKLLCKLSDSAETPLAENPECSAEVRAALAQEAEDVMSARSPTTGELMEIQVGLDDILWVQIIWECQEPSVVEFLVPAECHNMLHWMVERREGQLRSTLARLKGLATSEAGTAAYNHLDSVVNPAPATEPRITTLHPAPGSRTHGPAIWFKAEVDVGSYWRGIGGGGAATMPLPTSQPPAARCEVRVVVDGEVAGVQPLYPLTGGDDGTGPVKATVVLRPDYPPSCARHTEDEEAVAAATTTPQNEEAWIAASRELLHSVCTEALPSHNLYAELYCCGSAVPLPPAAAAAAAAAGSSGWLASCDAGSVSMVAASKTVSVFHVGNGEAEDAARDQYRPPPENLELSFWTREVPEVSAKLVVPRWLPEAQIWQRAYRLCSENFGASAGVNVEQGPCMEFVVEGVRQRRLELYHKLSWRLTAHLTSLLSLASREEIEGHTGDCPEKVEALGALAREGASTVSELTICEVGFNAGHSTLNWLLSSPPSARVIAFDIGLHQYVEPAVRYLEWLFPGRLEVTMGDSHKTLPDLRERLERESGHAGICNMVLVDGDHTAEGAGDDLEDMRHLANRTWNRLLVDDYDAHSVSQAVHGVLDEGKARLLNVVKSTGQEVVHVANVPGREQDGVVRVTQAGSLRKIYLMFGTLMLAVAEYVFPAAPPADSYSHASSAPKASGASRPGPDLLVRKVA